MTGQQIMPRSWLDEVIVLLKEVEQSNSFVEPREELRKGEEVLGDMSSRMKALFTLWQQKDKASCRVIVDIRSCKNEIEGAQLFKQAADFQAEADIFYLLLWLEMSIRFPILDIRPSSYDVRKGHKVVLVPYDYNDLTDHFSDGSDACIVSIDIPNGEEGAKN